MPLLTLVGLFFVSGLAMGEVRDGSVPILQGDLHGGGGGCPTAVETDTPGEAALTKSCSQNYLENGKQHQVSGFISDGLEN